MNSTLPAIIALLCAVSPLASPLSAAEKPVIVKHGTIDLDLVETTPVAFNGRLYRFEWVREGYWNNQLRTNHFRFVDHATGEATLPFAMGHEFGSAFVEGGTVCVTGTQGRSRINLFASRDLKHWESWPVLSDPRYGVFNTSLCRAGNEYVLMFEIDRPAEEAGAAFTARFLKSADLRHWELTPPECNYAKDRYTAPHCLRYLDGWFYNFYLEAHQGYEMRVVRSKDFVRWTPSPLNPVLRASAEDKQIANSRLTAEQRARIEGAVNLNNSDIDFCEFNGQLVINYSWGNQQGVEFLAEGHYAGPEKQFLAGWFPGTELRRDFANEPPAGFTALFNGRDLTGWKAGAETRKHWQVENGVLRHDGVASDLWSEKSLGDFVLMADWRWPDRPRWEDFPLIDANGDVKDASGRLVTQRVLDAGDSGIFLRGIRKSQVNLFCYRCGSGEVWEYRTDAAQPLEVRQSLIPKIRADRPVGDWNRMLITMRGDRVTVVLNDEEVIANARLPGVPARGTIGFQHEHGRIEFRNVFVKELRF